MPSLYRAATQEQCFSVGIVVRFLFCAANDSFARCRLLSQLFKKSSLIYRVTVSHILYSLLVILFSVSIPSFLSLSTVMLPPNKRLSFVSSFLYVSQLPEGG